MSTKAREEGPAGGHRPGSFNQDQKKAAKQRRRINRQRLREQSRLIVTDRLLWTSPDGKWPQMDKWHYAILDAKASASTRNILSTLYFEIYSTSGCYSGSQAKLARKARSSLTQVKAALFEARMLGLIECKNGRIYPSTPRWLTDDNKSGCTTSEATADGSGCTTSDRSRCTTPDGSGCTTSTILEEPSRDLVTETFVNSEANATGGLDVKKEETQSTEDSANGTELNPTACTGVTPSASQRSGSASKEESEQEEALALSLTIEAVFQQYGPPSSNPNQVLSDKKSRELFAARMRGDEAAAVAIAHELMAAEGRLLRDRNGLACDGGAR
jgi:hypothetical protein